MEGLKARGACHRLPHRVWTGLAGEREVGVERGCAKVGMEGKRDALVEDSKNVAPCF